MKPSIIPVEDETVEEPEFAPLAALGRRLLLAQFARLRDGELRIVDGGDEHRYGQRTARCPLTATIEVLDPQFYADVAFGGTVGSGAAYIRGHWRCSDLTALVRIMVVNRDVMEAMDSRWSLLSRPLRRLFHFLHRNSRNGSARNIAGIYSPNLRVLGLMPHPEDLVDPLMGGTDGKPLFDGLAEALAA